MNLLIAVCLLSGAVVSVTATALLRRLAPAWGLVDKPNARKVHTVPTALGGGIGIWLGIVLPLAAMELAVWWLSDPAAAPSWLPVSIVKNLAGVRARSGQLWGIVLGGSVISALGLIDDLRNLRWQPKLLVQLLVACGLVTAGVRATVFSSQPWVGWCLSVLWIVILTNAFNFLDNMDALSGGIGLIASVVFAIVMLTGTSEPRWFVAGMLLILAGSLGGFLVHNWPPAKIFMGDAGSCLVGLLLASLTMVGTFYDVGGTGRHVILAPLCVLAVPLYDFCSVVLIRLSQGRSPFHADKCHFSHRLVEMGLTRVQAVLTIHLVTLTTGLGGLLLYQVRTWTGAFLVVGLIVCVLAVIAILEWAGRGKES
jgi:UDP-GlcNAc:undecaprenyl-phosphate GlcNAc-1-phosphate transferase